MRTLVITLLCAAGLSAQELPPQMSAHIGQLIAQKHSRTPAQRKVDSHLLRLSEPAMAKAMRADASGRVLVDIDATVSEGLLSSIRAGGAVVSSFPRWNAVRAWLPANSIEALASRSDVRSIRPADQARRNGELSEGYYAHAVNVAAAKYGRTGRGVKVGVLSDSASLVSVQRLQATGDLPLAVTLLPGQDGADIPGAIDEGTGMMEIVHDMAPGAELFFATAFTGQAQFAQNILDLRFKYGCGIIVDDVSYFAESAFQDGIIAQAVTAVTNDGAAYFSSAGNSGNAFSNTTSIWEGDFVPAGQPPFSLTSPTAQLHAWQPGAAVNAISPPPGFLVSGYLALQWSDPWTSSSNDYDLFLMSRDLTRMWDYSTNVQSGPGSSPLEFLSYSFYVPGDTVAVVVLEHGAPRALRLDTFGSRLQYGTAGATYGHNATAAAITAAAANASGKTGPFTSASPVETYSSDGPRKLFYDAAGNPINGKFLFAGGGGTWLSKPDMVGADCVLNRIFTPPFTLSFCGTSAAAPHLAAIAALLKESDPGMTPAQIRAALISGAQVLSLPTNVAGAGVPLADRVLSNSLARLVILLYQRLLGRTPDPSGLAYWTGPGASPAEWIAEAILTSAEFQQTRLPQMLGPSTVSAGVNNQQLVGMLYQTLLSRPADSGGFAFWTAVANSLGPQVYSGSPASLTSLVRGFVSSPEFLNALN